MSLPILLRFPTVVLIAALVTPSVPGSTSTDDRWDRLPEQYRSWLDKEVIYIIDDRERDAFLDLQSVGEWEAFIEAFWRGRDPDRLTPVNEFREEHYRRIEHANRVLGRDSAVPGWMTDRGKMYIMLGPPNDTDVFRSVAGLYPAELWFYLARPQKGLPPLYLLFFQDGHAGAYRLFNHAIDGPEKLMPAAGLSGSGDRLEAYQLLQDVSPDLAHASVTMRADRGGYGNVFDTESSVLETMGIIADIYESPHRGVDTRYIDAAERGRGLVESEYLFNYVSSVGAAHVLPGPNGTSFVHYGIEIEPQNFTLAKDETTYYTTFDLSGEVTTLDGETTVLRLSKERFLTLTESQFQQVSYRPFAYRNMFPLVEGDFSFRIVLKNRARSEYTVFETQLRVPKRGERAALGDPVLLYEDSAILASGEEEYSAYHIGSMELDPNARRIYAIGEPLFVYVPIDNASAEDVVSMKIDSLDSPGGGRPAQTSKLGLYADTHFVQSLSTEGLDGGYYRLVVEFKRDNGDNGDNSDTVESRSVDFDITPLTRVARPWSLSDSMDGRDAGPVLASLAEQHLNLGQLDDAGKVFRRALAEDPALIAPRVFLARVALDDSDPDQAIGLLEPRVDENRDNVELLVTLADAYVRVANYQRASELFEASILMRRPTTTLLNALAACHVKLGNNERARDYLEQSFALDATQEKVAFLLEQMQASTPR